MLLSESIEDGTAKNLDEIVNHMRLALMTNNDYLEKAILKLYKYQTEYEQQTQDTAMLNGVGFNTIDANVLSSLAEWILDREHAPASEQNKYVVRRHLTDKQRLFARKKVTKYAGQLVNMYVDAGVIRHIGKGQWKWVPKAERDRIKQAAVQIRDAETAKFKPTKFERPSGQLDLFDQSTNDEKVK